MEELLLGGNIGGAVRVDDTVRRVAGPHTSTVHRLLRHLRTHGFPEAPEPLGVDDRGREVLRFVAGDVPSHPLPSWVLSDDALCSVGRLLRRFHDATLSFTASRNPHWQRLPGAPSHGDVICHNDLAPYNTVYRDGRAVALIDWDYAAPGTRQWDIAHAAWRHVPIGEHTPVELAAPRLSLLCDAYGLTERAGLVDVIADRQQALHDTVREFAASGDPAFAAMWRTGHSEQPLRDRAHLLAHRGEFLASL